MVGDAGKTAKDNGQETNNPIDDHPLIVDTVKQYLEAMAKIERDTALAISDLSLHLHTKLAELEHRRLYRNKVTEATSDMAPQFLDYAKGGASMTARQRPLVVVCAAVGVLIAACTDGGGAAPTSSASVTSPASMTTTSGPKLPPGVPPVRVPLDIKAFVADPCKGITESQKRALSEKGVELQPGA